VTYRRGYKQAFRLKFYGQRAENFRRYQDLTTTRECGAVKTTYGGNAPDKYVVFARNDMDCMWAMSDSRSLENMAAYTSTKGRPTPPHNAVAGMPCSKLPNTGSMLICTDSQRCIVMSSFTRSSGRYLLDEWVWSAITRLGYDPFYYC